MSNKEIIYVKSAIEGKKAIVPSKGSEYAHCHDLFLAEDFAITPGSIKKVASGLIMEIPTGYAALIRERSSTISKYGITVEAGDIDSDYRGHVMIVLHRKDSIPFLNALKQEWNDYIYKSLDNAYTFRENVNSVTKFLHDIWIRLRKIINPYSLLKNTISTWYKRRKTLRFKRGDALAQIEIVKVNNIGFAKAPPNKVFTKTKRGSGGFGSTTKLKKGK